jgi:hypothetical protein
MTGRLTRTGDRRDMAPGARELLSRLSWEDKKFDPMPVRTSIFVETAKSTPALWTKNSFVILRAILTWGNDGGSGEVVLDVRRGVVACLPPCQAMSVTIEYLRAPSGYKDGPPLTVSVSSVYGDAPPQQAIYTDYLGPLSGPEESAPRKRIPAFADRALIMAHDSETRPLSGLYLRLYGDNNGGAALASFDLAERQEAIVPQGAEWYTVYLKPAGRQIINTSWLIVS